MVPGSQRADTYSFVTGSRLVMLLASSVSSLGWSKLMQSSSQISGIRVLAAREFTSHPPRASIA